ncbi:respiratory nitrate reductase subunit gamma [Glutamicibacter sp. MNS18]|uniref:respiratory nitrate reductase subunit gamma n=1 Tax=Glutamicibacter sp. MNS18 TaxID=2989817 RepID=UPI0022359B78|nr:respiratory nitrate reductase subunit gamma [Glutamicibacter sp. MNS18]MCW4466897.1 respiratory nitrate reductase subunit gamma [Glutamicibacter sp. MNS18]
MSTGAILLWVVLPYAAAVVFVVGHIWRYRFDKFGWTTRSSQTYESRLLRWGSPMFHIGILMVIAGHVVGLLIPREWLYAIGITEHIYHLGATWMGTFAAVLTLAGLAILVYRRRTTGPVFLATTPMDKVMYVFLGATLAFGTLATLVYQVFGPGFSYRESISPWVRGMIIFQPDPALMLQVPLFFQLHVVTACLLFALWPFTRLVHVFSAPIPYLFRPYIVYRSRDAVGRSGMRPVRRGWDPVTAPPEPRRGRRSRVPRP